ncbi:hypothetical protein WJX72_005157 [[Myrmecia] bisecta]|uniref:non-specific serine/threonine protein kinase n=1 Tax=[Myrmecia] bisecta TaxID=41462 RepID=A0AAW1R758_9CHLO
MVTVEEPIVSTSGCTLIGQGAEARVWEGMYLGQASILKQRFSKKYRHSTLDAKLTVGRLKQEVRSMLRARKVGVLTPVVQHVDHEASTIYMQKVIGRSIKDVLHEGSLEAEGLKLLMAEVGRILAKIHDGGLVHGDLTTSNMMIRTHDGALVLIDFGLSYNSSVPEDKGVDLYVLERAFTSAHSTQGNLMDMVLESYRHHSSQWSATFNKFAEVRMRGRKRAMLG